MRILTTPLTIVTCQMNCRYKGSGCVFGSGTDLRIGMSMESLGDDRSETFVRMVYGCT